MTNQLTAAVFSALLACGLTVPAPMVSAESDEDDRIYFEDLARQGRHPDYDRQICGSIKCAALRDLLVQEGCAVCSTRIRRLPKAVMSSW